MRLLPRKLPGWMPYAISSHIVLGRLERSLATARAVSVRSRAAARSRGRKGSAFMEATNEAFWEEATEYDFLKGHVSEMLVRRFRRYDVPVPDRVEGDAWSESIRTGDWIPSTEAAFRLRHEIAAEIEVRQKPWLNWAGVLISVLSLVAAILALTIEGHS